MRPTILLGLLGVLVSGVLAQTQPNATEIVKKVSETYRAAKEYELIATSTGGAVPGRSLVAFRAPNLFRMEGGNPDLDNSDGTFDTTILVHDGSFLWVYYPKSNEYVAFPTSLLTGDLSPEVMDDIALGRYRNAADLAENAMFLREETLEIAGAKSDCYVVSTLIAVPKEGTTLHTLWIEKKSNRVLRDDHADSSVVFTTIRINEPLPDDLFKFVPPPGARKIVEK